MNPKFDFKKQFSKEKLRRFLKLAGISNILPAHATLSNLGVAEADLGKKSVLRNPLIADLLNRADYIEKMGTGVNKMRRLMKAAGLKRPKFESTGFLTISFVRPGFYLGSSEKTALKSSEKGSEKATPKTTLKLSQNYPETILKILELLGSHPYISSSEMAAKVGLTKEGIKYNLNALKKNKVIKRVGPARGGHWEVL